MQRGKTDILRMDRHGNEEWAETQKTKEGLEGCDGRKSGHKPWGIMCTK